MYNNSEDITNVEKIQPIKSDGMSKKTALYFLGAIILLGAFLRFYKLGEYSIGNTYYAAAVKSMLTSWKNFFYVSFEPGGSVTVDKPPLGLWVQTVSAYFLGVNGFALALPQALAGTLSIPILYSLVKRYFGIIAGLIAAVVLAVVPVTVATERNNTMDGLLVFVLLLAAWAFMKAAESGKISHLLLGAVLVGLGFNIKMLQAFMPLPAFYAVYFFGAKISWRKRIIHLSAAAIVLVVVSLSWAVIVDLTPPDDRPYIGSSSNNTVMGLIVGHNGLSRLGLNNSGTGRASGQFANQPPNNNRPGGFTNQQGNFADGPADGGQFAQGQNPPNPQTDGDGPQDGRRGNRRSGETGTAGILRLFREPLVTEASWALPLALLGIPLVLVMIGCSWPLTEKHIGVILWAGWLLPTMAYFSITTGLFHRYYLIMIGPPIAALIGITAWSLIKLWKRSRWGGFGMLVVLTGITILFEIYTIQNYPEYAGTITAATIALWIAGIALLIFTSSRSFQGVAIGLVLASVLVAPFTWSIHTTFNKNPDVALPTACADAMSNTTILTPNHEGNLSTDRILEYILQYYDDGEYLLATLTVRSAAPFILDTGLPVLTFGGFTGSDDVVSVDEFADMIAAGKFRFVLGIPTQKRDITEWIFQTCSVAEVPGLPTPQTSAQEANNNSPYGRQGQQTEVLFDCGS